MLRIAGRAEAPRKLRTAMREPEDERGDQEEGRAQEANAAALEALRAAGADLVARPELRDGINPDALKVIRRLNRRGHLAFLVGGGVRDLLLGRSPKDFDIATSASPEEVRGLFRNCRLIGRRFRLAHVYFAGGHIVEVATFRAEPRAPRPGEDLLIRHDNTFGEPDEDARRRDFTLNGLFYDVATGQIVDFVDGLQDVALRTIRMIGDPVVRLQEDPVRILRAIKFSARLDAGIDAALLDAMIALRSELAKAAPARLFEEILRFMRGGAAHRSFFLAWETGVLAELLPPIAAYLDDQLERSTPFWRRLAAIDRSVAAGDAPSDTAAFAMLMLCAIEDVVGDDWTGLTTEVFEGLWFELEGRLLIPKRLREQVRLVVRALPRIQAGRAKAIQRRDYYPDAFALALLESEASGVELPSDVAEPLDADAYESEPRPKRRRRRRRGG